VICALALVVVVVVVGARRRRSSSSSSARVPDVPDVPAGYLRHAR
jgi:hypothetical protein